MNGVADVFAQWRYADAPQITVSRLRWPALEHVTGAAGRLRPHTGMSSFSASSVSAVFAARRLLTGTPLAPDHPLVGLAELTANLTAFVDGHLHHSLQGLVAELRDTVDILSGSTSPVGTWFGDVLSCYGESDAGHPEAVVLVPRRGWLPAVGQWLLHEELTCVDLATPGQLRRGGREHAVAVVAGHPAVTLSFPWRTPDAAARETGWLFTAPPAPHVRVALQVDSPPLRQADLWLLPATAHSRLDLHDDGPSHDAGPVRTWLVDEHRAATQRPRLPADSGDGEALGATAVTLASGHTVYFHPEVGPRPHVVAVDDETESVALSAAAPRTVRPGMLLALRVGAAPYAQVRVGADEWLAQHRGWSTAQISHARAASMRLKRKLINALASQGSFLIVRRLERQGISPGYAQVLVTSPLEEHYIAPLRRAGYDALISAVGADELAGEFDRLAAVRTAHQQAGEQIRRDTIDLLRERRWLAHVDDEGWATIGAGTLGTLLIAVITGVEQEPVPVGRTWLGVPVDSDGRRVTSLPLTEECQ